MDIEERIEERLDSFLDSYGLSPFRKAIVQSFLQVFFSFFFLSTRTKSFFVIYMGRKWYRIQQDRLQGLWVGC